MYSVRAVFTYWYMDIYMIYQTNYYYYYYLIFFKKQR